MMTVQNFIKAVKFLIRRGYQFGVSSSDIYVTFPGDVIELQMTARSILLHAIQEGLTL